jgi:hypothetical protein
MTNAVKSQNPSRDESGSVLVLALVYLVAISLIVAALTTWSENDLNNTAKFNSARSLQYAATSVTDLAIQNIRYTPLLTTSQTLNASPPSYCWGTGWISEMTTPASGGVPGYTVASWCSSTWDPASASTRVVTISTCVTALPTTATQAQATAAAAVCAANPYLQAVVTFDDYPPGVNAPTTSECNAYCGSAQQINSWVWGAAVPTVTNITPGFGPYTTAGGTIVQIVGTGFTTGATVNFVSESGGTPVSTNVVYTVTPSVITSTSLTVRSPGVTSGTNYFVTVTTPSGGTSAFNASGGVFVYAPAVPTVSSVSPASGVTTGGTSMTITGTGFFNGASVNFVPQSGGSTVTTSTVTVNSSTSITLTSPVLPESITTYWITVTTSGGTSTQSSSQVFLASPTTPTVTGPSGNSGPIAGGTGFTVTGTGFVVGSTTVTFTPVLGAPTYTATGISVQGSTTVGITTPAVLTPGTYYFNVTTPGGTSANGPTFTYY